MDLENFKGILTDFEILFIFIRILEILYAFISVNIDEDIDFIENYINNIYVSNMDDIFDDDMPFDRKYLKNDIKSVLIFSFVNKQLFCSR